MGGTGFSGAFARRRANRGTTHGNGWQKGYTPRGRPRAFGVSSKCSEAGKYFIFRRCLLPNQSTAVCIKHIFIEVVSVPFEAGIAHGAPSSHATVSSSHPPTSSSDWSGMLNHDDIIFACRLDHHPYKHVISTSVTLSTPASEPAENVSKEPVYRTLEYSWNTCTSICTNGEGQKNRRSE